MSQLETLQNDEGIWCDTYVDRTFHWAREKEDVLPYRRPWIGFVHHTFDTDHSDYNNVKLLGNSKFLESLVQCKGLFVFALTLKTRWDTELQARGFNIPVTSLIHPTDAVSEDKWFSIPKFLENKNKKIVSIGAWLRDIYAIYELNDGQSPVSELSLVKTALQGPQMQGYFKPANFFRIFTQPAWKNFDSRPPVPGVGDTPAPTGGAEGAVELRVTSVNGELPEIVLETDASSQIVDEDGSMCRDPTGDPGVMCRDVICRDSIYALNKYVVGAISHLKKIDDSVTVLPTASDAEYDSLLMQNVVFIKLHDAGAVNTVLECMTRNTPILVNKLPSVVEILGNDYPLFYDDVSSASEFLTLDKISEAHNYLKTLDKTIISGAHFLSTFTSSAAYEAL